MAVLEVAIGGTQRSGIAGIIWYKSLDAGMRKKYIKALDGRSHTCWLVQPDEDIQMQIAYYHNDIPT